MPKLTVKETESGKKFCRDCEFFNTPDNCTKFTIIDIVHGEVPMSAKQARFHSNDCGPDANGFSPKK